VLDQNSSSHPVYRDGTSTANASGFEETSALHGNLASMMRNWVLVTAQPAPQAPHSDEPPNDKEA
jgi:hypothetical protein